MRARPGRTVSQASIQGIQSWEVAVHRLVGPGPLQVAHIRNILHNSQPAKKLERIVREVSFP
jgi:hypothetical protein